MPQPQLSPTRRLVLWSGLLAAFSLVDLTLTAIALSGIPSAVELNPLARLALARGLAAMLLLKLAAAGLVLLLALALARTPFARMLERVLAFWCVAYLCVNAFSALQLLGVI